MASCPQLSKDPRRRRTAGDKGDEIVYIMNRDPLEIWDTTPLTGCSGSWSTACHATASAGTSTTFRRSQPPFVDDVSYKGTMVVVSYGLAIAASVIIVSTESHGAHCFTTYGDPRVEQGQRLDPTVRP